MSRWTTEFEQHPFQAIWVDLKTELSKVEVDDQTVSTSVSELARLKMVVTYLDEVLALVNPEMTPKNVWSNFHSQASECSQQIKAYVSNKNISHIIQANEHADNLLSYVKPYLVFPKDISKALIRGAREYSLALEQQVEAFREKTIVLIKEITEDKNKSSEFLSQTEIDKSKVAQFNDELFEGSDDVPSIQKALLETKTKIEKNAAEIQLLYEKLLTGDGTANSIAVDVTSANQEIQSRNLETKNLVAAVNLKVEDLTAFHSKIFGKKSDDTEKSTQGLEFELEQRTEQLLKLESDQKLKHAALFAQIESLLPGATSAGLASSYDALKKKFDKPIETYTRLFYLSLLLLGGAALVMSVKQFDIYPKLSISFVEIAEWDLILRALIYKVPFIAPVIWLAVFSTTRRSQYERLQQEYAHKEALASSYESYKKQLQDLKGDSDDLQKALISKAIDAIAYNASTTLDGKHEDKLPVQQLLEKLSLDDAKKLLDFFKEKGKA